VIEEMAAANGVASPLDPELPLRNKGATVSIDLCSVLDVTCVLLSIIWFLAACGIEWYNWIYKVQLAFGVPNDMAVRYLVIFNSNELVVPALIALVPPALLARVMNVSLVTFSTLASAAVALVAMALTVHASPPELVSSSIVAAYLNTSTWVLLYTLTPTMFPAQTRGTGFGFCMMWNRCGYIVCPLIAGAIVKQHPNVLFFGCSGSFLLIAFFACFLRCRRVLDEGVSN